MADALLGRVRHYVKVQSPEQNTAVLQSATAGARDRLASISLHSAYDVYKRQLNKYCQANHLSCRQVLKIIINISSLPESESSLLLYCVPQ